MWMFNRPSTWLLSLPEDEFRRKMEDAKRQATPIMKLYRERARKIAELQQNRQQEKWEKKRAKENAKVREREELDAKKEELGGLWRTVEQVDEGLARVKDAGRGEGKGRMLDALKVQIQFRKKVLQQPVVNPKDWTITENSKTLDVPVLRAKLVNIIGQMSI